MKQLPRVLMIIGALSLLMLFAYPIWKITLKAPQYPDGMTMYIWINKITGDSESTLQNINILNHYVGMKYIEPDTIPELTYFPYVIIGMIVLGSVAAIFNRKYFYLGWIGILAILGVLGMYDFYLWEYDYGHNLSPEAPIKVPGQAYQPPLIGSKMLLNFEAISLPATGFYFLVVAMILAAAAFFTKKRLKTQKTQTWKKEEGSKYSLQA